MSTWNQNRWNALKQRMEQDPEFARQYKEKRREDQRLSYQRKHGTPIAAKPMPTNPPVTPAPTHPPIVHQQVIDTGPDLNEDQIDLLHHLFVQLIELKQEIRSKDEDYNEQIRSEIAALEILIEWLGEQ